MLVHVAFTGTQKGMTLQQISKLLKLFVRLKKDIVLHHGDCIGADIEAHAIAMLMRIPVILHPPVDPKKRGWSVGAWQERRPKPYLERDRDMVFESALLFAAPATRQEVTRSGTWYTVRYARAQAKDVRLIFPNGRTRLEKG